MEVQGDGKQSLCFVLVICKEPRFLEHKRPYWEERTLVQDGNWLESFNRQGQVFQSNNVEFEAELKSAGEKLIVVDFSATWCGPCKMIKPFFHSLCEKYGDVVFIEIDVDDAQDVASHCDVKCMPTFQFYKNGKKVQEFSGANKEKLEETIKSLV
ncbi:PREDICTED: thioredoxin-like [Sturnus vulgaris]|nr:PREDICTED: thioredoxin-like [Sturnus vulgaris]